MRVTILGCGSSSGVPMIGCGCSVCTSENPKNSRTRASILIELEGFNLLVDTSPDLRRQALDNGIQKIDAVLFTHNHADHTHGLDELRSFNYLGDKELPIYGDADTLGMLQVRFGYAFQPRPEKIWYRPALIPHILPDADVQEWQIGGHNITLFRQPHGRVISLGVRAGGFAYSTDTDQLADYALDVLQGVDVWVVDCLRYTPSLSHSYLERTLEWIKRVRPKLAVLTHMSHDLEYDKLRESLPHGVIPAHDGMVFDF